MKFGKRLLQEASEVYLEFYVDYTLLKKVIKSYSNDSFVTSETFSRNASSFIGQLKVQIEKINLFSVCYFANLLNEIFEQKSNEKIDSISHSILFLERFQTLNFTGIRKLGKKFDKRFYAQFRKFHIEDTMLQLLDFAIKQPFLQLNIDLALHLLSKIPKGPTNLPHLNRDDCDYSGGPYQNSLIHVAFPAKMSHNLKTSFARTTTVVDKIGSNKKKIIQIVKHWSAERTKEANVYNLKMGDPLPSLPDISVLPKSIFCGFRKYPYLASQVSIKKIQQRRGHSDAVLFRRAQCDPLSFRKLTYYLDFRKIYPCAMIEDAYRYSPASAGETKLFLHNIKEPSHLQFNENIFPTRTDAKYFVEDRLEMQNCGDLTIGKTTEFLCPNEECPSRNADENRGEILGTLLEDFVFTSFDGRYLHSLDRWDCDEKSNSDFSFFYGHRFCNLCNFDSGDFHSLVDSPDTVYYDNMLSFVGRMKEDAKNRNLVLSHSST
eukprot:GHVP01000051.1.p1 GENE.GHVP01000051.1~~GHVP01000051.1.p1  ORF type:complete len:490 (+),score=69.95 GHVP01000051.1:27-1496(+)